MKDAIPEARRIQLSRLVTPEVQRADGTLLALQAALRLEARLVLPAEPPDLRRALLGVAIGAVTVGAVTTVGAVAVAMVGVGEDGAGEDGAGALGSDGRTGDLAGDWAGPLGGTTLIGMPRGPPTATRTIRITGTTRTTIRRTVWIRRLTTIRREAA